MSNMSRRSHYYGYDNLEKFDYICPLDGEPLFSLIKYFIMKTADFLTEADPIYDLIKINNDVSYCLLVWDKAFNFVDCNSASFSVLGFSDISDFTSNPTAYIPSLDYNNYSSIQDVRDKFDICKTTSLSFKLFTRSDKSVSNFILIFQKMELHKNEYILGYVFEIDPAFITTVRLQKVTTLFQSINTINKIVVESLSIDACSVCLHKIFYRVLEVIGKAEKVDRAYIWKNYKKEGFDIDFTAQICEWVENCSLEVQGDEVIEYVMYEPEWYNIQKNGGPFHFFVDDLGEYAKSILEPQDIKTVIQFPIFIDKYYWGFIGYDNCHTKQYWDDISVFILKQISLLVVPLVRKFDKKIRLT